MLASMVAKRSKLRGILRWTCICLLAVLVLVGGRALWAFRDRSSGYSLALNIAPTNSPAPLRAGFARIKINPDLSNTNTPVWMAGFSQNRAVTRIHDDLWAVACVLDDGHARLGVVVLDAIGFFHDDVIEVRRRLKSRLNYAVICSTHNHSTPDLMGLWGRNYASSGVNAEYREQVIQAATDALDAANAALQPARLAVHEIPMKPDGLLTDTRKPRVFDPDIRVLQFISPSNSATIGSIIGWANHPETVWSRNTEITADYPGVLRDAIENGVKERGMQLEAGLGGIHLYINGAIGGLMSTTPSVTVRDPYLEQDFKEPTHQKATALGRALARVIIPRMIETNTASMERVAIGIKARTISVSLENSGYLIAPIIGVIDRGQISWKRIRTEVGLITLGDVAIACVPGEIYPEIVNGGIEAPEGRDYAIAPLEVPPLRELMPGKTKLVFGMANDEIGYLVPKSQWDQKAPYTYGSRHGPYGEINSCGPDAAATIHSALKTLCAR
jgi:hypothetical protein